MISFNLAAPFISMPLPPPSVAREPLHTRTITVESFAREDGLWDLEASLLDVKSYDFPIRNGQTHKAGDPVHLMHLRITIDSSFAIVDAVAVYDAAPYQDNCSSIADAYQKLVGLNLLKQFRQGVKERFGRSAGCTHMSELAQVLPTAAVQTMAGRRRSNGESEIYRTDKQPFHLDGCHALRLSGPVVEEFYPVWYRPKVTDGVD